MRKHAEEERRRAVARVQAGESVAAIAASLGRSRKWVYTWCARAEAGAEAWAEDRSHRPVRFRCPIPPEVVAAVRLVRLELYNAGLLCGAQNIRWRLEELAVSPLPSVRTINRIVEWEG
jgi:transposase-like protein